MWQGTVLVVPTLSLSSKGQWSISDQVGAEEEEEGGCMLPVWGGRSGGRLAVFSFLNKEPLFLVCFSCLGLLF